MTDTFGGGRFGGGGFDNRADNYEESGAGFGRDGGFGEIFGGYEYVDPEDPIEETVEPTESPIDVPIPSYTDTKPEEELHSLAVRNEDIVLGETGEFERTSGMDNVMQSAALDVRDALQYSIGDTLTTDVIWEIEATIRDTLRDDPQLDDLLMVETTTVNENSGEISLSVAARDSETFSVELSGEAGAVPTVQITQ